MTTEDARKLFVAGLPESMTEDVLRQLFEATGSRVVEVSLPKDRATGRPRGFGFVTLQTGEQAEKARSVLDGSVQVGRAISVRPFQGATTRKDVKPDVAQSSSAEDRTLYVGNLPYDATAEEVEKVLERAGVAPVLRVHLPMGPDGRPRGFGFVTLASPDAVLQAIPAMQNADLRGRRVMVKVALPRGTAPPRGSMGGPAGAPIPMQHGGQRPDGGNYAAYNESPPPPRAYREPQPSADFEDDEDGGGESSGEGSGEGGGEGSGEGVARASAKPKTVAVARGAKATKAAPAKRKGERVADDRRSRGGGASWQRWEDWDDD